MRNQQRVYLCSLPPQASGYKRRAEHRSARISSLCPDQRFLNRRNLGRRHQNPSSDIFITLARQRNQRPAGLFCALFVSHLRRSFSGESGITTAADTYGALTVAWILPTAYAASLMQRRSMQWESAGRDAFQSVLRRGVGNYRGAHGDGTFPICRAVPWCSRFMRGKTGRGSCVAGGCHVWKADAPGSIPTRWSLHKNTGVWAGNCREAYI